MCGGHHCLVIMKNGLGMFAHQLVEQAGNKRILNL